MAMPERNNCIKRRLFYATAQAYPVDDGGRFALIGWTRGPDAVARPYALQGPDALGMVDRALVGRIPEGVLVVFRGTLPPMDIVNGRFVPSKEGIRTIFRDWMNNLDIENRPNPDYDDARVHHGFARSTKNLWEGADGVKARVDALLADGGPRKLYITGHSKGGPLANLTAYRARKAWPDVPVKVVTIAAARPGDRSFAEAYDRLGIDCVRYEVDTDLVPLVPPGVDLPGWADKLIELILRRPLPDKYGYVHVGEPRRKTSSWWERMKRWGGKVVKALPWAKDREDLLLPAIDAHLISASSLYNDLVCEGGCDHEWAWRTA
jgi:hypothetical protein